VHTVWTQESMVDKTGFVSLCFLRFPNLGYRWYDFSEYQKAFATLVSCYLAADQSEILGKCAGIATHSWFGMLSHSLAVDAQAPTCYGTTGAGSPLGRS